MARVVLVGNLLTQVTGGVAEFHLPARSVQQLFRQLEALHPAIAPPLASGVGVAIDGLIYQDALFEAIGAVSEVFLLPAIAGGWGGRSGSGGGGSGATRSRRPVSCRAGRSSPARTRNTRRATRGRQPRGNRRSVTPGAAPGASSSCRSRDRMACGRSPHARCAVLAPWRARRTRAAHALHLTSSKGVRCPCGGAFPLKPFSRC